MPFRSSAHCEHVPDLIQYSLLMQIHNQESPSEAHNDQATSPSSPTPGYVQVWPLLRANASCTCLVIPLFMTHMFRRVLRRSRKSALTRAIHISSAEVHESGKLHFSSLRSPSFLHLARSLFPVFRAMQSQTMCINAPPLCPRPARHQHCCQHHTRRPRHLPCRLCRRPRRATRNARPARPARQAPSSSPWPVPPLSLRARPLPRRRAHRPPLRRAHAIRLRALRHSNPR